MQAVREEIERTDCKSVTHVYNPVIADPSELCPIYDERTDVDTLCSTDCALIQDRYFYCTYLGERALNIFRECGIKTVVGADFCSFNNDGFCLSDEQESYAVPLFEACAAERETRVCSNTCREAVETFRDAVDCCVALYSEYRLDDSGINAYEWSVADLFSICGVGVPEPCTSLSPPERFLNCARRENETVTDSPSIRPDTPTAITNETTTNETKTVSDSPTTDTPTATSMTTGTATDMNESTTDSLSKYTNVDTVTKPDTSVSNFTTGDDSSSATVPTHICITVFIMTTFICSFL